ncbi:hypothetical protein N0V83_004382 [Neocucurbitaria cava]|uniref:Uncharacterized protein n=1 Tax=Neocucurbitaria cava TaxID=798079 RepID=A0A9W8YAJ9_9PLEO|nr:hypothetical protein N0V83_004382 [Neocucurbitaria cava]
MPSTVRPPPAYIAASVASQTVTDHHNAQLRQEDADSEELENAVFSEQALALLNAFLDHLLFAFLSSARSPSLTAVRPAIQDVLKPRLAREAMEAADEELEGLLAGEDDEELPAHHDRASDKWDVEKVWKRTRLRIMVYTRLGELEDEDEDRYVQQERGLSMDEDDDDEAGLVSWAAAIFLTSVVEYVAEQTLLVSGSAAFARMAAKQKKLSRQSGDPFEPNFERLIIEEPDVEKIALNSALGRLWRTWRKRVRSPISPLSPGRGVRPVSSYSSFHTRKASHDTINESFQSERSPIPEHTPTETEIAANIPLPLGDNDVNEIEVPGLARTYEQDAESSGTQTPVPRPQRPSSVIMLSSADTFRRRSNKERPLSMPLRPAPLFSVPPQSAAEEAEREVETPFETSLEQPYRQDEYFEPGQQHDESSHDKVGVRRLQDSPEPDAEMVAFAASTGMGFRMSTVNPNHNDATDGAESDTEIPSAGDYEGEPKVMQSKRMSIEKTGPKIVRTFSTRSSSLRSNQPTPAATPRASQQPEGTSYLELSDEEAEEHRAIGIARTSDVPIRSTPTPPNDSPKDKGKGPGHGGYVEVHPRHSAPTSVPYRNTPTPDAKPIIPERSVARKDVHNRSPSGNEIAAASPSQYENTPSPPRRQEVPPPKMRGVALPPLQEVDSAPNKSQERLRSESLPRRGSPTLGSPKRSPSYPTRDVPAHVAERGVPRSSTDDSARSQAVHERSPSDKNSLKRGASSSSSAKVSGNFTVTPSGRSSEASQRPRNLSGRMSEEDREREFDSLVKGQETVKFTLTPQNMRSLDASTTESPVQKKVEPARPTTSSVTVYPRVEADKDTSFGTNNLPKRTASRGQGPMTPQHKSSPSRKVVSRQLAREPRIESESMRDFADFIRSTGPSPGQEKPVQPFVNISGSGLKNSNASTSSLGRRVSTKQPTMRNTEGPTAKPRQNMEPRSPAGLTSGNDDLIDFIRQGPPTANNGQPRIPRNVAPFRTTVDSDQFDHMLGNHGNVESAFGSTSSTLDSKHSTQTVNSRTGLIPAPKVVHPAYSNTPKT